MAGRYIKIAGFSILFVAIVGLVLAQGCRRPAEPEAEAAKNRPIEAVAPEVAEVGLLLGFPSDQTNLVDILDKTVYMPTGSGRVRSAHYGSTRTARSGLASFHEGIDIASLRRDSRNRALDEIYAVADGRVAYANRVVGNSNYGLYVVVLHDDPVGEVYSLYSHLRSVADEVKAGRRVNRGDVLGVMGNTPSSIIPVSRSHLHFEYGLVQNDNFPGWTRKQGSKNPHGVYHGWNLIGINPMDIFVQRDAPLHFSMAAYLKRTPTAYRVALYVRHLPDFFSRYPDLWQGEARLPGTIVLDVIEGGNVKQGRMAREDEALSSDASPRVLMGDAALLGRNGLHYVIQRDGGWVLGRRGKRWLDILTFR